jgi:hypothetical protein
VVADVLGDKNIDQLARVAFGELFQSWKTNGDFKAWQVLGMLLRKRLIEDPKRTLAQSYYIGAYQNPRCRLSMLIARLQRHWAKDPPPEHWDSARQAMRAKITRQSGPESLKRILAGLKTPKAGPKTPTTDGGK